MDNPGSPLIMFDPLVPILSYLREQLKNIDCDVVGRIPTTYAGGRLLISGVLAGALPSNTVDIARPRVRFRVYADDEQQASALAWHIVKTLREIQSVYIDGSDGNAYRILSAVHTSGPTEIYDPTVQHVITHVVFSLWITWQETDSAS